LNPPGDERGNGGDEWQDFSDERSGGGFGRFAENNYLYSDLSKYPEPKN